MLDEICDVDGKELGNIAYMLAQEKQRCEC
ncbi:hypothetical protein [Enterobacter ludwigii]